MNFHDSELSGYESHGHEGYFLNINIFRSFPLFDSIWLVLLYASLENDV